MIMEDTIFALRIALGVLSVAIIPLSYRGFFSFARPGGQSIANALRSVAFLIAMSSGSFQWGYLLGGQAAAPVSSGLLFSLVLILSTLVVCLFLLVRLRARATMEMARIEEHADVALAIAELDILSPAEAQMYATECRRRTAEIMVERGRGSRG